MSRNGNAMLDVYIDIIRENPARMESVLAKNKDIRSELEPILKTAVLLSCVEHPEIMPEQKRRYRQSVVMNDSKVHGNLWVNVMVTPDQEVPGKHIHG